jgi:tetratricopeptide (TPR) repeat protein
LSKKHKTNHVAVRSTDELKARVQRARSEGRFQQALELAKQLHKAEPTPAHRELLKEVYLGRAHQLRAQGHARDAATVLEAAARLEESDPAWLERLAAELARLGEGARAQALLALVPEQARSGKMEAALADGAFLLESGGRAALPPALQADYDRVVQAFAHVEAGRDDEARAALQGVGLRSPFLEWKLLLRGLQAYYQNDDARALENWQRLDAERLPARLAAPFRHAIDPTFRAAQPPATQAALQQQYDRLQGTTLLPQLRALRTALVNQESLAPAFRQAEALLPALRVEAPHLLPRLATCFYWAVLEGGPDNIPRFQRVFGKPPDDPNFNRLSALAYDRSHQPEQAHRHWHLYEQEIAAHPEVWVGSRGELARALIWNHMGEIAESLPSDDQFKQLAGLIGMQPPRPPKLHPPAESCFRKSLELAPDLLDPRVNLVEHYLEAKKSDQAEKAARALLERFPDHLKTLEKLARLRSAAGDHLDALALLQQALNHNPLDRRLRDEVSNAHMAVGRSHAEAGRFPEARAHYRPGLEMAGPVNACSVLCRWATAEFKAGDPTRGEELLQQARGRSPAPLEPVYLMLVEAIRMKLAPALKRRFDQEFNEGLAGPAGPADAAALVAHAAAFQSRGINYRGLKTHVKKVLAFAQKARRVRNAPFTEDQLLSLCTGLVTLDAVRNVRDYLQFAAGKFPRSPHFPYLQAMTYFAREPDAFGISQASQHLRNAERLAQAAPPDERVKAMLEDIRERLTALDAFNPFSRRNIFANIFEMFDPDAFFGGFEEDEDEDEPEIDFFPRRRGHRRRR